MSQIFKSTIHILIFQLYTKFQDSSLFTRRAWRKLWHKFSMLKCKKYKKKKYTSVWLVISFCVDKKWEE